LLTRLLELHESEREERVNVSLIILAKNRDESGKIAKNLPSYLGRDRIRMESQSSA